MCTSYVVTFLVSRPDGEEWEQAWNDHVASWQPPPGAENYVRYSEWEEDFIRTEKELKSDPYPDNLVTMCIPSYTVDDEGLYWWLPVLTDTPHRVYCRALKRSNDDTPVYMVEMDIPDPKETIVVQGVEEDGIFLYDKAFSDDWHLPNAFRHEIMIPDDVIPQAWLNGSPFEEDDFYEEEEQEYMEESES